MSNTSYCGIKTLKNPLDFWVYQEIIFEQKPDMIIEIGNRFGGSTLALAHFQDIMNHGGIIGVDIDHSNISPQVFEHPRVKFVTGDAVMVFDQVKALVNSNQKILVIEDSAHTFDNTLGVLYKYSQLLQPGGYIIVEDSICHHGLDLGPSPGPLEAIDEFLLQNNTFESDRTRETFIITWNPKGFIRKK